MAEEKILTLHPGGKQGVKISKALFEQMRKVIIDALKKSPEQTFSGLNEVVGKARHNRFDGSIG